jgi:hypothetical protein
VARQRQDPIDLIPEDTRDEMLKRTNYWNNTFEN